jgi:hypothetical protein
MIWYLWSSNRAGEPQGVYSHETALEIYALSSWNSKKLHITVPPGFQRMVLPANVELHHQRLNPEDIGTKYGVRVTKPLITIICLLRDGGVPKKYLEEALVQAVEQQIILPIEIANADVTKQERNAIKSLLEPKVD